MEAFLPNDDVILKMLFLFKENWRQAKPSKSNNKKLETGPECKA